LTYLLVARHRREIQQLIDSARDRSRTANSSNSSSSGHNQPPATTPFRPSSSSNYSRSKSKLDLDKPKQPSWLNNTGKAIQSFGKRYKNVILDTIKALIVGAIIGAVLIFLKNKGGDLIPHRKGKIIHL
jgi:hypothetical protein